VGSERLEDFFMKKPPKTRVRHPHTLLLPVKTIIKDGLDIYYDRHLYDLITDNSGYRWVKNENHVFKLV